MLQKAGTFIGICGFYQGKKRRINLSFQLKKTEQINSIPENDQKKHQKNQNFTAEFRSDSSGHNEQKKQQYAFGQNTAPVMESVCGEDQQHRKEKEISGKDSPFKHINGDQICNFE